MGGAIRTATTMPKDLRIQQNGSTLPVIVNHSWNPSTPPCGNPTSHTLPAREIQNQQLINSPTTNQAEIQLPLLERREYDSVVQQQHHGSDGCVCSGVYNHLHHHPHHQIMDHQQQQRFPHHQIRSAAAPYPSKSMYNMTSAIIACNNQQHMLTHHHNSKRHHHTSHHRGNHPRNWETTQYCGNPLLGDGCVPLSEERYLLPTATSHGRLPQQQQYMNSYSREGVRHQRDSWSSTRDEADLEVQRLTNSHCDGIMVQKGHTTTHQQEHDSQRDS